MKFRVPRLNAILAFIYLALLAGGVGTLMGGNAESMMLVYFLTLPWNLIFGFLSVLPGVESSVLASYLSIGLAGALNLFLLLRLPLWRKPRVTKPD